MVMRSKVLSGVTLLWSLRLWRTAVGRETVALVVGRKRRTTPLRMHHHHHHPCLAQPPKDDPLRLDPRGDETETMTKGHRLGGLKPRRKRKKRALSS